MYTVRIPLEVVPPPESEETLLIAPKGRGNVIRGGSDVGLILECGSCAYALSEGVRAAQLDGLILRCSNCGAFNRTKASGQEP